MLKATRRANPTVYTKRFYDFKGVDYSSAVTEVDDSRSPDAPNMVADYAGFPQKRCGFKILRQFDGKINAIYSLAYVGGRYIIVHAGTKLYLADGTLVYSGMADSVSSGFVFKDALWLLDGTNYVKCTGLSAQAVTGIAYVPTTSIGNPPTGGGEPYEPVNLLSAKRINSFYTTAGATVYTLDAANIDGVYLVEKLIAGVWTTVPASGYTVNTAAGTVTFASAPETSTTDNVKIYFTKAVSGAAEKITHCTINALYGYGGDTRVFVSGNPSYRNLDWYCGFDDPTYFPDTGVSVVGNDEAAVMGYLNQYEKLVIVKEYNSQDSCIFLRSSSLNSDNDIQFAAVQGLNGVGAISKRAFGALLDDNMFLSSRGVFGLDSLSVSQQQTVQCRSNYVNAELVRETALDAAFSVIHDGYYMLFVNERVYLADSRQRNGNSSNSYGYEWFYWTDIKARCGAEIAGTLYIGDADGYFRKLKTIAEYDMEAYSDEKTIEDGAAVKSAIYSAWTTKMDTLGDAGSYKKICKRRTGVLTKPFAAGSGKIYYITDSEDKVKDWRLTTEFDFDDVDFDKFDFGALPNPSFVPCNRKVRKTKMIGIRVVNDTADESFGVFEIQIAYEMGNPIKY